MHPWARILTAALAFAVVIAVLVYFYSPEPERCPEQTLITMQYEHLLDQEELAAALEDRGYEWQPGVGPTANIVPPTSEEQFVNGEYEEGPAIGGGNASVITFLESGDAADNPGSEDAVQTVARDVASIVNTTFPQEQSEIASWIRAERTPEDC